MKEQVLNKIVFVLLVFLILIGYFVAESTTRYAKYMILSIAFIKFILVGYFFMGVRHSHFIWNALIVGFISIYVLLTFVLTL